MGASDVRVKIFAAFTIHDQRGKIGPKRIAVNDITLVQVIR